MTGVAAVILVGHLTGDDVYKRETVPVQSTVGAHIILAFLIITLKICGAVITFTLNKLNIALRDKIIEIVYGNIFASLFLIIYAVVFPYNTPKV